jgi:hypothetical protein
MGRTAKPVTNKSQSADNASEVVTNAIETPQTNSTDHEQAAVEAAELLAKQKDLEAERAEKDKKNKGTKKFSLLKPFAIDGELFDNEDALSKLSPEKLEEVKKSGYVE